MVIDTIILLLILLAATISTLMLCFIYFCICTILDNQFLIEKRILDIQDHMDAIAQDINVINQKVKK